MSEVEETLKRINSHKGVIGIVIINSEGIPIRSTLDTTTSQTYAQAIGALAAKARSAVRTLDPQNDLTFLRVRSKKHEIMVAPEKVRARPHFYRRARARAAPAPASPRLCGAGLVGEIRHCYPPRAWLVAPPNF